MKTKQLNLSQYLKKRSKEICADNKCTEDEHNCESYAYIDANLQLLDICGSDYFQGSSKPHAAISLPWAGTMEELKDEVIEQCYDALEQEGRDYVNDSTVKSPISDCPYRGEAATFWKKGFREAQKEKELI